MLHRVVCLIKRDITNGLRDNMVLYILIFPIVLALAFKLFIPSVQGAKPTYAVISTTDRTVMEKLVSYGNVEVYDSLGSLRTRVEQPDDVTGIYMDDGKYIVMAEGNETGSMEGITGSIINMVTKEKPLASFRYSSLDRASSPVKQISASMLALSSIIIAGLLIAFNMVEEKETKFIKGLAVAPVTMSEYIGSKALAVLVVSMVLVNLGSLILMGADANYLKIAIGVLVSGAFGTLMGFTIGGLADNQMSAIALMKVLFIFIVFIPVGSLFMPASHQWLFYAFPHYWVFQIFQNIFAGAGTALDFWGSCTASFAASIVFMAALVPVLRKKLKLRR